MTAISTNPVVSVLDKCKSICELRQIHAQMIKTNLLNHQFTVSRLIAFCSLSGVSGGLDYASSVFSRIQHPNSFIFFAVIKGFSDTSNPVESLILYARMLSCLNYSSGVEFSIPSVLKACGKLLAFDEGRQVHGQVLKTHLWFDPFVGNSMVRMYIDFGEIELARRVFDRMPNRDVVSWNSMIAGYLKAGEIELASELFDEMPERDLVSCNAMIDGYGKCGRCELAEKVFETMSDKDVVTWTSMISAYVQNRCPMKALDLFREMLSLGLRPDGPAIVSVLSAIADLALIDMYSKCGYIENAYHVFRSISHRRNIGDWNSMISGLAIHGLAREALDIFVEMERMDIEPNEITFLGLLSTCSHGGLVEEGQFYFESMHEKYKIVPRIQHYGCMIDLFGRAGRLEDALGVIQNMPFEADLLAWKAILSASMKHGHIEIGKSAALRAIELAPDDSSSYVLLSNIYAKAGRWDDVAKIRLMMRQRGVKKIAGCSSMLVDGKSTSSWLKLQGYEPDLTQVLLDIEDEGKESLLNLHSEKMAVAFGLIHINKSAPIHIVKNLRVCCDCHCFMKLVSKVYNRQIIMRDQNRFHHFENGCCSCNEYW
ncbi:Pentatricopeptide repeat-containing protein, chloroplastic [Vitis vinifera]|uniref:Pentatricopeptide repeat-containing protein, chloroplastic n=1 Tax=Vitis vinifera TaxID=29760 RepID=A0A438HR73_VITVI|nr:Pentatricopeptide repeat-containing protein, chloroplastic [Vitis vinifera]